MIIHFGDSERSIDAEIRLANRSLYIDWMLAPQKMWICLLILGFFIHNALW